MNCKNYTLSTVQIHAHLFECFESKASAAVLSKLEEWSTERYGKNVKFHPPHCCLSTTWRGRRRWIDTQSAIVHFFSPVLYCQSSSHISVENIYVKWKNFLWNSSNNNTRHTLDDEFFTFLRHRRHFLDRIEAKERARRRSDILEHCGFVSRSNSSSFEI